MFFENVCFLNTNEDDFLHGVKGSLSHMKNNKIKTKYQLGHQLLRPLLKIDCVD